MKVDGITWHAVTLDETSFAAPKRLYIDTFGLKPMMAMFMGYLLVESVKRRGWGKDPGGRALARLA